MNREETKELIKVMQAYVDGEVVEFINQYCKWQQIGDHHNWGSRTQYRIKPKPRIIWAVQTGGGSIYSFGTDKKDALSAARVAASIPSFSGAEAIPYRELTPEEREEAGI
jgi:hypothetical protein